MELTEELKYRLAYLTLRLVFDAKLSASEPGKHPATLEFLDLLAGTNLAGEGAGRRYASQRDKLESFIDAEFGDDVLALCNRLAAELA